MPVCHCLVQDSRAGSAEHFCMQLLPDAFFNPTTFFYMAFAVDRLLGA